MESQNEIKLTKPNYNQSKMELKPKCLLEVEVEATRQDSCEGTKWMTTVVSFQKINTAIEIHPIKPWHLLSL